MNIELNGITYERRFLTSWQYNAALIFDELENIVLNNGGAIVSTWAKNRKAYAITNRSILGAIQEEEERIERYENINGVAPNEKRAKAIAAAREKLDELKRIPNDPHVTYYGDFRYICFALNGIYFYYSVNDNPFFEFHYSKAKIKNGQVNKRHYLNCDKKDWFYDCFLYRNCSHADIKEAANLIFNMLMNAHETSVHGKPLFENLIVLSGDPESIKGDK